MQGFPDIKPFGSCIKHLNKIVVKLGVLNKLCFGIMRFPLKDAPTDVTKEQQST